MSRLFCVITCCCHGDVSPESADSHANKLLFYRNSSEVTDGVVGRSPY